VSALLADVSLRTSVGEYDTFQTNNDNILEVRYS